MRSFLTIGLLLFLVTFGVANVQAAEKRAVPEDAIVVNVVGTLRTGVIAIGGETAGTTVIAKGIEFDVDFGDAGALLEAATKLNGQKVTLVGALQFKKGVERKNRWVILATELKGFEK
jgi:predicted transcriptional regulator